MTPNGGFWVNGSFPGEVSNLLMSNLFVSTQLGSGEVVGLANVGYVGTLH